MNTQCPPSAIHQMTPAERLELFGFHLQVLLEEFNELREELASGDEQQVEDQGDHDDSPSN